MVAIVALVSGMVMGVAIHDARDVRRSDAAVNALAESQDRQFESLHILGNLSFVEHDLLGRLMHYVSGHKQGELHIGCPVCSGSPRQTPEVPTVSLEPEHRSLEQALVESEENRTMVRRASTMIRLRLMILNRLLSDHGDEG